MTDQVKIMILSGVREQGKDMFAVQVNDEIFVLDAGLKYPDSTLFGIDLVIPDMDFFEQYGDQVVGIFLTHGHADSIGALPYILRKYDIPVFGSQLTIELAKITVRRENKRCKNSLFHVIDAETEIEFKNANISFSQLRIPSLILLALTCILQPERWFTQAILNLTLPLLLNTGLI